MLTIRGGKSAHNPGRIFSCIFSNFLQNNDLQFQKPASAHNPGRRVYKTQELHANRRFFNALLISRLLLLYLTSAHNPG